MKTANCKIYAGAMIIFTTFCVSEMLACPKKCVGYQGWTRVNPFSCGDPAGSCLGGSYSDCAPCLYTRSFGICVASTSGVCYADTSGPTRRTVFYTYKDNPLPPWKEAWCLAVYLMTHDEMAYCICLRSGDSCEIIGVQDSDNATGCVP